jgi:hypothetical protein
MRMRAVVAAVSVLVPVCCTLLAPRPAAQCATSYLLTGSPQFGQAFDVSDDLLVLGDSSLGFGGTAIVMRHDEWGWVAEYSLFSSAPETNGRFGDAVAIAGDWAAVGAPGEAEEAGAVHVFRRICDSGAPCTWEWVERLQPAQTAAGDRFGTAVALDGSWLVASAPGSDVAAGAAGALFLFELEAGAGEWVQVQTLTAGPGVPGLELGSCVALRGGVAVTGSKSANRAWVFEAPAGVGGSGPGPFGPAQELSDPVAGNFGVAVATDGMRVLVGSPGSNVTSIKSGAAYLFEPAPGGGWMQVALLAPAAPAFFAAFGTSVAIEGPTVAIGSPGANLSEGALFLYHHDGPGWSLNTTLATPLPGPDSSGLGVATALDGDTLVVGARATFGPPGVVYTFGGIAPWTELGGGLAGSAGLPALQVEGSLCGGDTIGFTIVGGKPKAPALVVIGLEATPQPWKGGVLWPAPQVVLPLALDLAGTGTLAFKIPGLQPSQQAVFAQGWIADPGAPAGLSATPAVTAETP